LAIVVMNLYPVRYLHIGRLMGRRPLLTWCLVVLWLGMMFTPYFGVTILVLCSLYVASPLFTSGIDPAKAAVEGRAK
jgi:hypothetical protein